MVLVVSPAGLRRMAACASGAGQPLLVGEELRKKHFSHHSANVLRVNNGSFGACPDCVLLEQNKIRKKWFAEPDSEWLQEIPKGIELARECVAARVAKCPTEDMVLVDNVTTASSMVSHWLVDSILTEHWAPRGAPAEPKPQPCTVVVLATNFNYRAVKLSMERAASRLASISQGQIELAIRVVDLPFPIARENEVVETYAKTLESLKRECAGAVLHLAYLDHIVSLPAMILPVRALAAMCKGFGFQTVFCDGAHAPGMIPNLAIPRLCSSSEGDGPYIDMYTANLHKWYFAPTSSALFYVHPKRIDLKRRLHHPLISHNVYADGDTATTCRDGFEGGLAGECRMIGTRDYSNFVVLPHAISFYDRIGGDSVARRNCEMAREVGGMLSKAWRSGPLGTPPQMIGSTCMVGLPEAFGNTYDDAKRLKFDLMKKGIIIQYPVFTEARLFLRVSVAAYNSFEEYEQLRDAVLKELSLLNDCNA